MRAAIETTIVEAVAKFDGVHSIWLDRVADLVQSPNDEQEAFTFVRWLQRLAIVQACPIIGVLHLNPGDTGKSRGHLGSELNRKAEAVLRLTKNANGITTVTTQWSRHAPILKGDAPRFGWSAEEGRHVSLAGAGKAKDISGFGEARRIVAAVWRANPKAIRKHNEIVRDVGVLIKKAESTAKRKLRVMEEMNLITKAGDGSGYVLTAEGSRCCEPYQAA